jgi:hypothetical protein
MGGRYNITLRESTRVRASAPSALARPIRAARSTVFSRRIAPEVCWKTSRPLGQRAQGRPGARCTRGLACDLRKQNCTRAYRYRRSIPAFPAQWLYGLLRALPGERLFCLRRRADTSAQLSASTAAPEPHDFAVRVMPASSVLASASIASHRAFRDDREPPLLSGGTDAGMN